MILKSIELSNFVSHDSSNIDFATGVNLIVGHNGAGKSSVVDAIKFALFNERRSGNIQDLIKRGKQDASVRLGFNMGGIDYEVYRSIAARKGAKEAWLRAGGSSIAETSEGVTSQISRVLGMSKDVFLNSVFVKQGDIDSLIAEEPRKRKDFLAKVINIERLGKQASKIGEYVRRMEMDASRLRFSEERYSELVSSLEENRKTLESLSREASTMKGRIDSVSSQLQEKTRERDDFYKAYQDYLSKMDLMKTMKQDINSAMERIDETKKLMDSLSDTEKRRDEIENDPLYRNGEKVSRYLLLGKDLQVARSRLSHVTEGMERYESLEVKLKTLSKDFNEYNDMEKKVAEIDSKIVEGSALVKEYETALQIVEMQKKRIEKLELESRNIEKFRDLFPAGASVDGTSVSELQSKLNSDRLDASGKIETIKAEASGLTKTLGEVRHNLETLGGKSVCPLCGTELTKDHVTSMLEEYRNREKMILSEISDASERRSELTKFVSDLAEKIDRIQSVDLRNLVTVISNLDSARVEFEDASSAVREKSAAYDQIKALESEEKSLRSQMEYLKKNHREYSITIATRDSINISEFRSQSTEIAAEISIIEGQMKSIEKEIGFVPGMDSVGLLERIRKEYSDISKKISQLDSLKVTEQDISQRIREMEKVLSDLSREIDIESNSEIAYKNAEQTYQTLRDDLLHLQMIMAEISGRETQVRENVKTLTAEKNIQEGYRLKFTQYRSAISKLEEIRKAFDRDGIQKMIRKRFSSYISDKTVSIMSSFNLNIDDVVVDEDLDIQVSQNGAMESMESLSGGERTALAIAVRLAISSYLENRISTIIMDEPTTFLDEDRRADLRDIIQYSLRDEGIVPQLVLITHHKELYSVADAMYEIRKDNGTSEVTRIG